MYKKRSTSMRRQVSRKHSLKRLEKEKREIQPLKSDECDTEFEFNQKYLQPRKSERCKVS